MNTLLANPAEFSALVQRFFAERLLQQQAVSSRTVAAYRDTFRLLLGYAERQRGKPPSKLALGDFDAELILGFLTHLEGERHNTVRSRNARLAAVRAFARYVAVQCPPALMLVQQILAIPMKRFDKPLLGFLSRDEVLALLTAPDPSTWCSHRDRVLFQLLYNTGARVSELIGIRIHDLELDVTPSVSSCALRCLSNSAISSSLASHTQPLASNSSGRITSNIHVVNNLTSIRGDKACLALKH